jgi:hypothetical protein
MKKLLKIVTELQTIKANLRAPLKNRASQNWALTFTPFNAYKKSLQISAPIPGTNEAIHRGRPKIDNRIIILYIHPPLDPLPSRGGGRSYWKDCPGILGNLDHFRHFFAQIFQPHWRAQ